MALVNNLKKMVHRKAVEYCCPAPIITVSGSFIVSDKSNLIPDHDIVYYVASANSIWNYNADEDSWLQLPNSGIAGTFSAGSCGEFRALSSPAGVIDQTATAGTTTTITTSLTIVRAPLNYKVQVIGGTGSGYEGTITKVVLGANSVITVSPASSVAFDATTKFRIFGGSLWFFNAGTTAVGFSVYDRITNTWTARSVTGLPTAWGTDAQLVSTGGYMSNNGAGFITGTSTGSNTTTTLNTGKTFVLNQWTNYQVRITSGTGAGQIRAISSNTIAGIITVGTAWTTTPDATSVYRIEGNDDYFYLLGNNAITVYRYSISGNSWTTLSPTTARAAVFASGGTADWIDSVTSSDWTDGTYGFLYSNQIYKQNGRYLYCFRGSSGNILDVYDIAANTWINGVSYGQQMEVFGAGSCSVDIDGNIYLQKDATSRIFRFNVAKNTIEPFVLNPVPQGVVTTGDKMFMTTYSTDGGVTKLNYLYTLCNTRTELVRWVVI